MKKPRVGIRRSGGAFTLVELLTAIGIIALLASVLASSVGRARDHARLALCKTRLHNLGVGLTMYALENRDLLPVTEHLDNPQAQLLACLDDRHVGNRENFYCPSQTKPDLTFSPANVAAGNIGFFFYSCRAATTNRAVSTFLRWDVPWPRELRAGMSGRTWVMSDCWFSGEPTSHGYYKKGVNYLTLDGAVSMVESSPRLGFE